MEELLNQKQKKKKNSYTKFELRQWQTFIKVSEFLEINPLEKKNPKHNKQSFVKSQGTMEAFELVLGRKLKGHVF